MLGLGGDFIEVAGPTVGFSYSYRRMAVKPYAELDAVSDEQYANATTSWNATQAVDVGFCSGDGAKRGCGATTTLDFDSTIGTSGSPRMVLTEIDFDSVYTGRTITAKASGTATMTWNGTLSISPDNGYSTGDRVLVLIEGDHFLNDQISRYVLDWEMKVHQGDADHPVLVLTKELVPEADSDTFLGAFYCGCRHQLRLSVRYRVYADAGY